MHTEHADKNFNMYYYSDKIEMHACMGEGEVRCVCVCVGGGGGGYKEKIF